jgi:predicted MFS family arabinose efflux permease
MTSPDSPVGALPHGPAAERPVTRDPRLWALALGNFAMGTGAMMIAGLLPLISADLNVSTALAGQLVTAFAVAVALGGPLLASPTSRIERRHLLTVALGLFIAASLLGSVAASFGALLLSRVAAGLAASLFTPHASGTAAAMVGPERRGRAISLVFIGFTMASVLGVPMGMLVGHLLGWRMSLVAVAGAAAVALAVLWRFLPLRLHSPVVNIAGWIAILRNRQVMAVIISNATQILGQMMTFSYIAALLAQTSGFDGTSLGLFMTAFGLAGVAGNIICGRLIDRIGPARTSHLALGTMVAAFVAWILGAGTLLAAIPLCLFWGLGAFAVNTAQQTRLVAAAPLLAGASLPLNSSAVYVGQALGAGAGGLLLASVGVAVLPLFSLGFILVAFAISAITSREAGKPGAQAAS